MVEERSLAVHLVSLLKLEMGVSRRTGAQTCIFGGEAERRECREGFVRVRHPEHDVIQVVLLAGGFDQPQLQVLRGGKSRELWRWVGYRQFGREVVQRLGKVPHAKRDAGERAGLPGSFG